MQANIKKQTKNSNKKFNLRQKGTREEEQTKKVSRIKEINIRVEIMK